MIRVDNQDIPKIVREWCYGPARTFEVKLISGNWINLDMDCVRDNSCACYSCWGMDADQEAIDCYIERFGYY